MTDQAKSGQERLGRRRFLTRSGAGLALLSLSGSSGLSQKQWVADLLGEVEKLTRRTQRLFAGAHALAPEFGEDDIAPEFRANGTLDPGTDEYSAHVTAGFKNWRITVHGLVDTPLSLSLDDIKGLPSRTQITRHDCVEGWSCIGKWKGVPLAVILAAGRVKPEARYVVFRCADNMSPAGAEPQFYYESLDLLEATHPQTLLAYELNNAPLPVKHGAPIRLRAERQLGYKMAKYIKHIEVVAELTHTAGGRGGYWEDQGYSWYGGI